MLYLVMNSLLTCSYLCVLFGRLLDLHTLPSARFWTLVCDARQQ